MKKRFILIAAVVVQSFITASAQKINQADTTRKQYTQLVEIETNAGESIRAALDRVTTDSVFITALENDFVKVGRSRFKILREETETSVAIDQIKSYRIYNDPYIIYRDCFENRKGKIKRQRFGKTMGTVGKIIGAAVIGTAAMIGAIAGGTVAGN